jgi:hypothetical protein
MSVHQRFDPTIDQKTFLPQPFLPLIFCQSDRASMPSQAAAGQTSASCSINIDFVYIAPEQIQPIRLNGT